MSYSEWSLLKSTSLGKSFLIGYDTVFVFLNLTVLFDLKCDSSFPNQEHIKLLQNILAVSCCCNGLAPCVTYYTIRPGLSC